MAKLTQYPKDYVKKLRELDYGQCDHVKARDARKVAFSLEIEMRHRGYNGQEIDEIKKAAWG